MINLRTKTPLFAIGDIVDFNTWEDERYSVKNCFRCSRISKIRVCEVVDVSNLIIVTYRLRQIGTSCCYPDPITFDSVSERCVSLTANPPID